MTGFFTRESKFGFFIKSETGMSRLGVLLIMLLLIAGAGFIFYFTDLLRPGNNVEPSPPQGSLVKKPMPPRPAANVVAITKKPANVQKEIAAISQNDAGTEKTLPPKSLGRKTNVSPQQGRTKHNIAKSVSAKPAKDHSAKETSAKSPAAAKPDATTGSATKSVKTAKKLEEPGEDKFSAKSGSGSSDGEYTLLAGVYVMEKSMREVKAKLKSAGLAPVVTKGNKKVEPMNRLLMGEFASYPEASIEMKKVTKITRDAFILPENGKYMLYAGSYFVRESAEKERERLVNAGLKPTLRKTNVPIVTYRLTAGNYQSSKPAEIEAGRLKKLGIKVTVVKSGS